MTTNVLNFSLDQGSNLDVVFTCRDQTNTLINLTGYDARVQVRPTYGSAAFINGTLANSKLVVTNAVGGVLTWKIAASDTAGSSGLKWTSPTEEFVDVVYDVELITPTGAVYKPARGVVTIYREVTR